MIRKKRNLLLQLDFMLMLTLYNKVHIVFKQFRAQAVMERGKSFKVDLIRFNFVVFGLHDGI
jgi:hypothetical protein